MLQLALPKLRLNSRNISEMVGDCRPSTSLQVVQHVVRALLGAAVKLATRTRGVYCVFPSDAKQQQGGGQLGLHNDGSCQVLNGMAYLDEVPAGNGVCRVHPLCRHQSSKSPWRSILAHGQVASRCGRDRYAAATKTPLACLLWYPTKFGNYKLENLSRQW